MDIPSRIRPPAHAGNWEKVIINASAGPPQGAGGRKKEEERTAKAPRRQGSSARKAEFTAEAQRTQRKKRRGRGNHEGHKGHKGKTKETQAGRNQCPFSLCFFVPFVPFVVPLSAPFLCVLC